MPQATNTGARVVLVDGWVSYRRSLRLLLEAAGTRVVGEAETVDRAAELAQLREANVVVLDPSPDRPRLERDLATLRHAAPAAGIVLLSSEPVPARLVFRAFQSGISAYLTKGGHPAGLLRAIEAALSKEFVLLPRRLLPEAARLVHVAGPPTDPRDADRHLTGRELEILRLAASSYSNREIANTLWVTDQTVRFHLANTYRKLGVESRADAIAAARRLRLLDWEDGYAA